MYSKKISSVDYITKPAKSAVKQPNFYSHLCVFLNGPTPASFSFVFGLFKQTIQFLQQINVKNVLKSIL